MVIDMKRKFYILSILSLLVAFNVNAKDMKKEPQIDGYRIKFSEIDKDGKGYITEKVYIKYHDKQWKLLDSMEEDFISKENFVGKCKKGNACDPKYKEKIFEEWDLNKDGKVTKKEYQLRRKLEFAKMDKNGTGKVSETQYNNTMDKFSYKYKFDEKTPEGRAKGKYKYEVK